MTGDFNTQNRAKWEAAFENVSYSAGEQLLLPMQDCVEFFKPRNVGTILDVGCGTGEWARYLARQGFLVSGFDFSENAVRIATERANRERIAAEFETAPVTAIPFSFEVFDAAVASLVFDVLSRRETAITIDALHERVRRGGLLFTLFNAYDASPLLPDATHVAYKDNELRALFPRFRLHDFRSYPGGLRGLLWKRE
jgi:2-polyprenyl-3-methyl-5-hydroxy-6-metoxy-1,4-benzoquinol methylase